MNGWGRAVMSRFRIKTPKKKLKSSYNNELQELKEWQDNLYNPGHYIGTGRLPYSLKNIARRPKLKLAYLIYCAAPIAIALFFTDLAWYQVIPALLVIAVIVFIIWDSRRILKKKYKG